jgi:putative ABC transport system ATP-binding protein
LTLQLCFAVRTYESASQLNHQANANDDAIAVECIQIKKDFGTGSIRTQAVSGKMTFLVGPSGCGKTTLISIIGGLLTPTAGEVKLFGKSLASFSKGKLADYRSTTIGFIFQQFNLLPTLSAVENAAVSLVIQGEWFGAAIKKATLILETLEMGPHLYKLPKELSGGQQQRVAIARAVVHAPKLIICDEPTASLDSTAGQQVMTLLRDVAVQPDRAVLIVTHDTRILSYADRIVKIADGRIAPEMNFPKE